MAEGTRSKVDDRLGVMERRLNKFETEFGKVNTEQTQQMDKMNKRLEELGTQASKTDLNLEEMKHNFAEMKRMMSSLCNHVLNSEKPQEPTITQISEMETNNNSQHQSNTKPEVTTVFSTPPIVTQPVSTIASTVFNSPVAHNTMFTTHTIPQINTIPQTQTATFTTPTPTNTTNPPFPPPSPQYTYTPPHTNAVPLPGSSNHQLFIPPYNPFTYQNHSQSHNNVIPPPSPLNTQFSPSFHFNPKLEFPRFDGTDPKGWVIKAEQYFDFVNLEEGRKVKMAGLHFDGRASVWYRYYQSGRVSINWKLFTADVIIRFENPENRDVQDLFNKLKQHTSVSDYEDSFEELRALVAAKYKGFPDDYYVSSFISGLKDHIKGTVRMFKPQSLTDAVFLAKQEESRSCKSLSASTNKNTTPKISIPYNNSSKPYTKSSLTTPTAPATPFAKTRSTLSSKDILARREKGQCFHCDDPYHPGKDCKSRLYMLLGEEHTPEEHNELNNELEELEALLIEPETPGEISLNAMAGNNTSSTIRLQGKFKGRILNILIDSGSTHSFMDAAVIKQLGLIPEMDSALLVTVADGSTKMVDTICNGVHYEVQGQHFNTDLRPFHLGASDVILGVDWLKLHSPVTFDYNKCSITLDKDNKPLLLKGIKTVGTLQFISGKSLKKMMKNKGLVTSGCICLLTGQKSTGEGKSDHPQEITNLLTRFQSVFDEPKGLPPNRQHNHIIPLLEGSQPVNQRCYRVPYIQKTEIESQIKEMLKSGIIQESSSPFASPIILVKKKDGTWRMCVDYRRLNDLTVKNKYPIPLIDELLDELKGACWFTKLDLRSGYHQIRVADEDVYKTAFRTHQGLYEFKVMPFGLTNAPASFQSLMNSVFQEQLRKSVLVFFDDILVYSSSFKDHLKHLEEVLQKMESHKLFAKASKCLFGQKQLEYLGHIISDQGVATDPDKVLAMKEWPIPTTIKQLRGFLGLTGYYRRFIKGYGEISRPLTQLLKKGLFAWSHEATLAFDKLKHAMSTAPVLALPDYNLPFVVETDASGIGIGAVLMQGGRPLAFLSKSLNKKQQGMSTYEKELLALVMACQKWHTYLQGHHFVIKTDHQSLKFLLEQRLSTLLQQKWLAKLMGLDYEIVYKQGKENVVADALSRLPEENKGNIYEITTTHQGWVEELSKSYDQDEDAQNIINGIATKDPAFNQFTFNKGIIKYKDKLFVGKQGSAKNIIMWEMHDSPHGGHSGQEATWKRVSQFFHWPQIRKEISEYVAACDLCQRVKGGNQWPGGLLQPLPVPSQIWEDISLDFVEGLPKSSDKDCIMVVIDRLTKVGHFIPLSHPFTATTVAQLFLDNIYKLHGLPRTMVSDRDKLFTSLFWKELFHAVGTKLNMSTSYHPQTDGQTERLNRCLEQYLRAMVGHKPKTWVKWLPLAEWWYNSSHHSAIKMSPYEALYGVKPRQMCIPATHRSVNDNVQDFQVRREAMNQFLSEAITAAQHKYKHYADSRRQEKQMQVGDWVFLKLQPYRQLSVAIRRYLKLSHKYFGPYKITEKIGNVAYRLELPPGSAVHPVFHVSLLKKKVGAKYTVTTELPRLGTEGQFLVYPVKILDRKMVKKGNAATVQWLVQWSNSIPEDATWELATVIQEQYPDFHP